MTETNEPEKYEDVNLRVPDKLAAFLHRIALDADTEADVVASVLFAVHTRAHYTSTNANREDELAAEVERLRLLAATAYAGLVAECDLPEAWADAFVKASAGEPFTTAGLLPFEKPSRLDDDGATLTIDANGLRADTRPPIPPEATP